MSRKGSIINKISNNLYKTVSHINTDYSFEVHKQNVRDMHEYYSANCKYSGISVKKENEEIIISLTTYGERIFLVHLTIESIMQQTVKPNRIILWLAEEHKQNNLPLSLMEKVDRGLEIKFWKDIRSYKKLIPTLLQYPDAHIITIDDDVIYPRDLIENLLLEHKESPNDIIFSRGRKISINNSGEVMPYTTWESNIDMWETSYRYLPVGVGGVLYPPNSLSEEVFQESVFMEKAPYADDLWFKTMALLKGVRAKQTKFGVGINSDKDFLLRFVPIQDEQKEKLASQNVIKKANDNQFSELINHYQLKEMLCKDNLYT